MTARSVARFVRWRSVLDTEPDADPTTHTMKCCVCGEDSGEHEDFEQAHAWQFQHAGRHPSHLTYRETIQRPWRCYMEE